jgi:hypothetical protein
MLTSDGKVPDKAGVVLPESSVARALAEERRAHINTLVDKVEEFYKGFAPSDRNTLMVLPTYVMSFPSVKDQAFVGALVHEINGRTAPLNNFVYDGKIVAESVYSGKELGTPVYKLKVDVVPRPEGGHHC